MNGEEREEGGVEMLSWISSRMLLFSSLCRKRGRKVRGAEVQEVQEADCMSAGLYTEPPALVEVPWWALEP